MSSQGFNSSGWGYYFEITSDNTKVDNANDNILYDFANAPAAFWDNVESETGDDIRITNSAGDTAYSFELENFSKSGETGIVFFDSSILATGSNTTWRIYYGNSGASMPAPSDTLGAENVWNSDYKAVFHLEDTNDSTSNDNNGTNNGATSGATGQIGDAYDFDGNGYIEDIGASLSQETQATLSLWIKSDWDRDTGRNSYQSLIVQQDSWNNLFGLTQDNEGELTFSQRKGGSDADRQIIQKDVTSYRDDWLYISAVYDSGNYKLYFDGDLVEEETGSFDSIATLSNPLNIANNAYADRIFCQSIIDDLRISNSSLSANWISTEYNNQSSPSTFWTTGSEQSPNTPPDAPTNPTPADNATGVILS